MVAIDEAKSVSLSVGGKSLDVLYYEEGSADQGSVIFMQTGGAGTTAYMCWHLNIDAFVDAGYRVYAPDAPGFGRSKLAAGATGPWMADPFSWRSWTRWASRKPTSSAIPWAR